MRLHWPVNSTTATYTPDDADRLMAISHAPTATPNLPFASFTYGRDNANQLTSVTSTGVPADNHTYAYTALNQLQKADNQNTCQVLRPGTGSFLSVDPAYDETQSRYGYVDGDPLNSADPAGLNKCEVGANPLRWAGNAVDCLSKADARDVLGTGMNVVAPGSGALAAHSTSGFCLNGQVGALLVGGSASICLAQSHLHEFGLTFSGGFTFGTSHEHLGASGSATGFLSDASCIKSLAGPFTGIGGTAGGASGEYQWGNDDAGRHVHVLSGGPGAGVEGHWDYTSTTTWTFLHL